LILPVVLIVLCACGTHAARATGTSTTVGSASSPTPEVAIAVGSPVPVASPDTAATPSAAGMPVRSSTAPPSPTGLVGPFSPSGGTWWIPTISSTPSPAQTRVPNSDALPTPSFRPKADGCTHLPGDTGYHGGGGYEDCFAYGLPPGAAVTLTANGAGIFLRIGSTVVHPDGTFYFPWVEQSAKTIVFVVSAGGVTRTFSGVF
jgi:hypothetical protein